MRMPSISDASRPSVSKATGAGSYSACGLVTSRVVGGHVEVPGRAAGAAGTRTTRALVVHGALDVVLYGNSKS